MRTRCRQHHPSEEVRIFAAALANFDGHPGILQWQEIESAYLCMAETLSDFAFWEARFLGIAECHPTMADDDPFRSR
jgi:hypothetical protein